MGLGQLLQAFTSEAVTSIPGGSNFYWINILLPVAVAKNFICVFAVRLFGFLRDAVLINICAHKGCNPKLCADMAILRGVGSELESARSPGWSSKCPMNISLTYLQVLLEMAHFCE